MSLSANTTVAEDAVARLLYQDKERDNLENVVRAFSAPAQTLETQFANLRAARDINSATDDALDKLGTLVGEARQSKPDDLYRLFIKARTLVNRSTGSGESIYTVARALLDNTYSLVLTDYPPASWILRITGATAPSSIADMASLILAARSTGVGAAVVYNESADADAFIMTDEADAPETSSAQGFGNLPGLINGFTYSQQFDNAAWSAINGTTVTADDDTGPFSDGEADRMNGNGSQPAHGLLQSIEVNAGQRYTLSVYVKPGAVDWVHLRAATPTAAGQWFDVTNGVTGSTTGSGYVSGGMVLAANGYYRCHIVFDAIDGNQDCVIYMCPADSTFGYVSSGSDLYYYGAMLESGTGPGTYVETEGTISQDAQTGGHLAGVIT